jgi:hypothetical protein
MVQLDQVAEPTLSGSIEEPGIAEDYARFKSILSSPRPYDSVEEAWRLYQNEVPDTGWIRIRNCGYQEVFILDKYGLSSLYTPPWMQDRVHFHASFFPDCFCSKRAITALHLT